MWHNPYRPPNTWVVVSYDDDAWPIIEGVWDKLEDANRMLDVIAKERPGPRMFPCRNERMPQPEGIVGEIVTVQVLDWVRKQIGKLRHGISKTFDVHSVATLATLKEIENACDPKTNPKLRIGKQVRQHASSKD